MISGEVIWRGVCGAYADLKVSGLTTECTGKHTGPWSGGGKRGQLNALRKNRHPRNGSQLQPPIPESTMTLDAAASASHPELAEAANRIARYSAKDKASARTNASNPLAALTDERRQWIENKRREALQRAARRRSQLEQPTPAITVNPSTSKWAARIRASFANKKARLDTTQVTAEPAVDEPMEPASAAGSATLLAVDPQQGAQLGGTHVDPPAVHPGTIATDTHEGAEAA